jgi:hypothetical protein
VKTVWSIPARLSLLCLALFCASMWAATWAYAGGSWRHPHATSHSFFENYWCDLLREPAHNGKGNALAVRLATLGFAALALALGPFWLELSLLFRDRRRQFVRVAGVLSATATAGVALVPSDRFPVLHGPAVLSAGGLGFACGCICASWAVQNVRRAGAFAALSLLLMAFASVNLVLYVWIAYFHGGESVALPIVQKLATLSLVAWMVAGLRVSANRPKP